jgi:hypothetical protein
MKITFSASAAPWRRFIERAANLLQPTTPGPYQDGLLAASDAQFDELRTRFEQASAQDGTWQALKPSTIREKESLGYDDSILYREGDLESSLKRGDVGHVLEITQRGIIEGTQDHVARYHQDGVEQNNLPARPFVVEPTDAALDVMKLAIAAGVQKSFDEAAK